jgi:RimJ/RimL family protein N-acetyltransferase
MAAAQANPRIFYAFGIVLRAENRLVGTIVLRAGNADRGAQVGWDVNRAYWNRGIATEAARSVLAFAFADLGVRAVHADSFARNFASIRVMEKLGMQRLTRGWFASMRLAERYGEWRPMIRYVVRPQRHTANVAQAPY